jgi:hypothetical protein
MLFFLLLEVNPQRYSFLGVYLSSDLNRTSFSCNHVFSHWWSLAYTQGLEMDCSVKWCADEMFCCSVT